MTLDHHPAGSSSLNTAQGTLHAYRHACKGQVADCHVSHEQDGPHFTKTGQHGHVSHDFHVADCHMRHEGRGPKKR